LPRFESIVSKPGAKLPTGDQRNVLKRAEMIIAQARHTPCACIRRELMSAAGYRSRNIALADAPKLDVFTFDGAELARIAGCRQGTDVHTSAGAGR
jgi:hypothetical protein